MKTAHRFHLNIRFISAMIFSILALVSVGCAPPVVEDLRFQNVPQSQKLSGQITNGAQVLSQSPTYKVVNGVIALNHGQGASASPSFRMTGGVTFMPPQ